MGLKRFAKICLASLSIAVFCINSYAEYDADDATSYANDWWGIANPTVSNENKWKIYNTWHNSNEGDDNIIYPSSFDTPYYNHYVRPNGTDSWFTDCAHFVSQCLIAGGLRDEMHDYSVAISGLASGQYTNLPLRNYGGLIFESTGNPHDPNNGYISYPANRLIAAYSQNANNNEWAPFVNTRSRSGNIY